MTSTAVTHHGTIPLLRRRNRYRVASIGRLIDLGTGALEIGERGLAPWLDLFIRLWLAQSFWVSGILKLADWQQAVYLAQNEYPVSWLSPTVAATLGVAVEVICPIFLALGLATRAAALPMLALSLVIQYAYLKLNVNVFWAILLGRYAIMGAGTVSLDRLIARGFAHSALPLAGTLSRATGAITRYAGPLCKLFIRYWMAQIFFLAGLTKIRDLDGTLFLFANEYNVPLLPSALAAYMATAVELTCPVLLVLGLGARVAALPMIGMTLVIQLTYLQHIDHLYWLMLLGLIVLYGPGPLALDTLVARWLRRAFPRTEDMGTGDMSCLPHVVVVGGGFGGIAAVKALAKAPCRVTLVDRRNYHLFQPLLYQVATASLSPADIAAPIRAMFRDQRNARVLLGRVSDVDTAARAVIVDEGAARLNYDYLVLATGARHSYFGHEDWAPFAPGLKKIDDAIDVRRRLLIAFERAETAEDETQRAAWMTFAIVGGGPTGVELAGAIAELAHHGLAREFRSIDPAHARVMLIQSGPRILPTFPEVLSAEARRALEDLGVEVLTGSAVEAVDAGGVTVSGQRIAVRTVFWGAGVIASPAAKWLKCEADRAGRVKVGPDLSVPGLPDVFALGDTALAMSWRGEAVPGLAPAAKQGGKYAASVIRARLSRRQSPAPFRYRHAGNMATIGRKAAVADFGLLRLSGPLAWWLWGAVHIAFLVGARNRLSVALEWFWAYLTFRRSTRLITGEQS